MVVVWQGWIYKQGSLVKSWKKRYAVVDDTLLIYYDKDIHKNPSRAKEKGRFQYVWVEKNNDIANGITLRNSSGKLLHLYTKPYDPNCFNAFSNLISNATQGPSHNQQRMVYPPAASSTPKQNSNQVVQQESFRSDSTISATSSVQDENYPRAQPKSLKTLFSKQQSTNSTIRSTSFGDIDCAGWLLKEGHRIKNWKKRYFILRGTEIQYFDKENNGIVKGSGTVINFEDAYDKLYCLQLLLDNNTVLKIAAENMDDKMKWFLAIQNALRKPSSMSTTTTSSSNNSNAPLPPYPQYSLPPKEDNNNVTNNSNSSQNNNDNNSATPTKNDVQPEQDDDDDSYTSDYDNTPKKQAPISSTTTHVTSTAINKPSNYRNSYDNNELLDDEDYDTKIIPTPTLTSTTSTPPPTTTPMTVFQSGWLHKKGQHIKSWKCRYFTLTNTTIQYAESDTSDNIKGSGTVIHYEINPNGTFCFDIHLDSNRILNIMANSKVDMDKWISSLQHVVTPITTTPTSTLTPTADSTNTCAEPIIGYSGWLLKEGQHIKNWKRRYFVLQKTTLSYYDTMDALNALGSGSIQFVQYHPHKPYTLQIQFDNSTRQLLVTGENALEIQNWYTVCQYALNPDSVNFPTNLLTPTSSNVKEREGGVLVSTPVGGGGSSSTSTSIDDNTIIVDATFEYKSNTNDSKYSAKIYQGWLYKESTHFKQWKHRYFVLDQLYVQYYDSTSTHVPTSLLGEGYIVDMCRYNNRKNTMKLYMDSGKRIRLAADSDIAITSWISIMQDAVEYANANNTIHSSASKVFNSNTTTTTNVLLQDDTIVCHGWLQKQGHTIKSWKRRYFVLKKDFTLTYYKDIDSNEAVLGQDIVMGYQSSHLKPNSLDILLKERVLTIAADCTEDLQLWIDALEFIIPPESTTIVAVEADESALTTPASCNTTTVTTFSTSTPTIGSSSKTSSKQLLCAESTTTRTPLSISYQGWLEKEGKNFKSWKRRYFTLQNGWLSYYNNETSTCLGRGFIRSVADNKKQKLYSLSITFQDGRVLKIAADSLTNSELWCNMLEQVASMNASVQTPTAAITHFNRAASLQDTGNSKVDGKTSTVIKTTSTITSTSHDDDLEAVFSDFDSDDDDHDSDDDKVGGYRYEVNSNLSDDDDHFKHDNSRLQKSRCSSFDSLSDDEDRRLKRDDYNDVLDNIVTTINTTTMVTSNHHTSTLKYSTSNVHVPISDGFTTIVIEEDEHLRQQQPVAAPTSCAACCIVM